MAPPKKILSYVTNDDKYARANKESVINFYLRPYVIVQSMILSNFKYSLLIIHF